MLKRWFQNIARLVLRGYNALYTFAFSKVIDEIDRLRVAKESAENERNELRAEVERLKKVHSFELTASMSTKVRVWLRGNQYSRFEIKEIAKLSNDAAEKLPKDEAFEKINDNDFERDYRDLQPHTGLSKSLLI